MVLTSKIKITGHLRLNQLGLLLVAGRKDNTLVSHRASQREGVRKGL